MRTYTAVVEQDPGTRFYVGYVPGFAGAHSQGETIDELRENLREVIAMLLEDGEPALEGSFVGIQQDRGGLSVGDVPVLSPVEVVRIEQGAAVRICSERPL